MKKTLLFLSFCFICSVGFVTSSFAIDTDSIPYNAYELAENPELLRKVLLREDNTHAETPLLGTETTINFSASQVTAVPLTGTKFVLAIDANTGPSVILRAGEITNTGTITYGAELTISNSYNDLALARLSDTEFVIGYAGPPEEGFIRKGTVTGTAISLSSATMFTEGFDDQENIYQLRFVPLDANNVVALYSSIDLPGNSDILGRVINLNSEPYSVGTSFDITAGNDWEVENFDAIALSSSRIAVAYKDVINGKIQFLDISGLNLSFAGSANVFYSGGFLTDIKLTLLDTTRLAVFYGDTQFSNAIRGRLGDISGTSISFTTPQTIANINAVTFSATKLNDTQIGISYADANIVVGQTNSGSTRILDVQATSFNIGESTQFNNSNVQGVTMIGMDFSNFVLLYIRGTRVNVRVGFAKPYTVVNLNNNTGGSLRWAIENANASTSSIDPVIDFDLPSGGTIPLQTELPDIARTMLIDGSTAGGLVTIDGIGLDVGSGIGFDIIADAVQVKGLKLVNFGNGGSAIEIEGDLVAIEDCIVSACNTGISLIGGSGTSITGNLIGTNDTGTAASSNAVGIAISSATEATIFGNVISGNQTALTIRVNATKINVLNNKIGLGLDGTTSVPNAQGIVISAGANNNLIKGNTIAHHDVAGISVNGLITIHNELSENLIYCNKDNEIILTGGNDSKAAPIILDANPSSVSGTCSTCTVSEVIEVFSDEGTACPSTNTNPQARKFIGRALVQADKSWVLSVGAALLENGEYVTATATAISNPENNNTSALAASFLVCEEILSPSTLGISDITDTAFTLTWPAVPNATAYRLRVALDANFLSVLSAYDNVAITDNTQIISGLDSNTEYFISLSAENTCAVSTNPILGSQLTFPKIPVATAATDVQGGSFQANWQALSGLSRYQIQVATDIDFINLIRDEQVFSNVFVVTGLTASTQYFYRVFAINATGSSSASNVITVDTGIATEAPSAFTATVVSIIRIDLSWEDNSSIETRYIIERRVGLTGSFAEVASLPANTTEYQDIGLNVNVEYCYRVRAEVSGIGFSAYTDIACAQPANVPNAPFNLNAAALSFDQVLLIWEYSQTNGQGFRIERASPFTENQFVEIAVVEIGSRSYIDNDVIGNVRYRYRIRAFGIVGNSPYSNRSIITTPTDPSASVPLPPFSLQAVSVSPQQIDLLWEYTTDPNVVFKIERSVGNTANFQPLADFVSLEFISTKRYNDTLNLQENTTYFYRIKATTSGGESAYSQIVSAVAFCNLQIVVIRDDSGSEIICGGKTASMTISARVFGASYQWRKNNIDIPGAVFTNYFASETGQYSCVVTVGSGGGCSVVSINQLLVIVSGSPDNLQLTQEGGGLQASVRDADSYEWYLDFVQIPGANQDKYTPIQSGAYYVIATVGACSSTSNAVLVGVTANEDFSLNPALELYPNPSTDYLNIKLSYPKNDKINVRLINMQGETVATSESMKDGIVWQNVLKVGHLSRGVYILELDLGGLRGRKKAVLY